MDGFRAHVTLQGLLYVTDAGNNCIQKFTPEGKFVAQFGTKGSGPGQLSFPFGITVGTTDLLYITEWGNHRVSIFTSEGQFVRSFGERGDKEGHFNGPIGITFNREGVLYVCDYDNDRLYSSVLSVSFDVSSVCLSYYTLPLCILYGYLAAPECGQGYGSDRLWFCRCVCPT